MKTSYLQPKFRVGMQRTLAVLLFSGFPLVNSLDNKGLPKESEVVPVPTNYDSKDIEVQLWSFFNFLRTSLLSEGAPQTDNKTATSVMPGRAKIQARDQSQNDFSFRMHELEFRESTAEATCEVVLGQHIKIERTRIVFGRTKQGWRITGAPEFPRLVPPYILNNALRLFAPAPTGNMSAHSSITTLYISNSMLVPFTRTVPPVINAGVTWQQFQRRLFADSTAPVLDALLLSPSSGVVFGLDPEWARVVVTDNMGDWIRTYGRHSSDPYQFAGARAIALDVRGNVYAVDAENSAIVRLRYSNGNLSFVSAHTRLADIIHPVDITVAFKGEPANPSDNRIWIVDDIAGKLVELDVNLNVLRTAKYYYDYGDRRSYPIVGSRSVHAQLRAIGSNGNDYAITFIDGNRNALVYGYGMNGPTFVNDSTIWAYGSTSISLPGSRLSSVGEDMAGYLYVADEGLGMLHNFGLLGGYLASYAGLHFPRQVTSASWFFNGGNPRRLAWIFASEPWSNSTGIRGFYPGSDALVSMGETSNEFWFQCTVTGWSRANVRIVRSSDNSEVLNLHSNASVSYGTFDWVSKTSLPYGNYKFRVEVKPYSNSFQYADSMQWQVRELPFSYGPVAPVISGFTQSPVPIYRYQSGTVACNLSQGNGNISYAWTASYVPSSVSVYFSGNRAYIDNGYYRPVGSPMPAKAGGGGEEPSNPEGLFMLTCTASNSAGSSTSSFYPFLDYGPPPPPPGGCPFVYAWKDSGYAVDNNILPQSQLPENEGHDVTDYYQMFVSPSLEEDRYVLAVGEFENEHSLLDQTRLLVIDHDPDVFITVDDSGTVIQFAKPAIFADAQLDSTDVLKYLEKLDGVNVEAAKDDTMRLSFTRDGGTYEEGLLLVGQVPVKEAVAGRVMSKNTEQGVTFSNFRLRRNMSYTWVLVPTADTSTVQIDIEWKQDAAVDYSELSKKLELPFTLQEAPLLLADHSSFGDVTENLRTWNETYTELMPQEWVRLEFQAPPPTQGFKRSFVFVSRGRYVSLESKPSMAKGSQAMGTTGKAMQANTTLPTEFSVSQNYPNPFNPTTVIKYQLPKDSYVTLKLYDILGREIRVLVDGVVEAGFHEVLFDASPLASGVYLYSLKAGDFASVKKLVLLR